MAPTAMFPAVVRISTFPVVDVTLGSKTALLLVRKTPVVAAALVTVLTLRSSESVDDPIEPAVAVRLADAAVMSTSPSPSVIDAAATSVTTPGVAVMAPTAMLPVVVRISTFPVGDETLESTTVLSLIR